VPELFLSAHTLAIRCHAEVPIRSGTKHLHVGILPGEGNFRFDKFSGELRRAIRFRQAPRSYPAK